MTIWDDFGLPRETTCPCFVAGQATKQGTRGCYTSYCTCGPDLWYGQGQLNRHGAEYAYNNAACKHHPTPMFGVHVANPTSVGSIMFRSGGGSSVPRQAKATFMTAAMTGTAANGYGAAKIPTHIIVNGQKVPMPPPTDKLVTRLTRLGLRYGSPQMVERYIARMEEDAPDDAKR